VPRLARRSVEHNSALPWAGDGFRSQPGSWSGRCDGFAPLSTVSNGLETLRKGHVNGGARGNIDLQGVSAASHSCADALL